MRIPAVLLFCVIVVNLPPPVPRKIMLELVMSKRMAETSFLLYAISFHQILWQSVPRVPFLRIKHYCDLVLFRYGLTMISGKRRLA
jgi:hypothetical protein